MEMVSSWVSVKVMRTSALCLLSVRNTSVTSPLQAGTGTKPKAKWWEKTKEEPGVRLVQKGFHSRRPWAESPRWYVLSWEKVRWPREKSVWEWAVQSHHCLTLPVRSVSPTFLEKENCFFLQRE